MTWRKLSVMRMRHVVENNTIYWQLFPLFRPICWTKSCTRPQMAWWTFVVCVQAQLTWIQWMAKKQSMRSLSANVRWRRILQPLTGCTRKMFFRYLTNSKPRRMFYYLRSEKNSLIRIIGRMCGTMCLLPIISMVSLIKLLNLLISV